MARNQDERLALGARLKAARTARKLTLQQVADALTDSGYPAQKAAVSAWEVGRNVPDSIVLKCLAQLFNQSADALLWDSAPSAEAMRLAASFDALTEQQQSALRTVWLSFVQDAKLVDALPSAPFRKAA